MAKVPNKVKCVTCAGSGIVPFYQTCLLCEGRGWGFQKGSTNVVACATCDGEGHVNTGLKPCPECEGRGFHVVMVTKP